MDISHCEFARSSATIVAESPASARQVESRYVAASALSAPSAETIGPFIAVKTSTRTYSHAPAGPLTAAQVFRDCSLRVRSSPPERRACRILMRQAAIKWRRGLAMGDL